MMLLSPSILSSNFGILEKELLMLNESSCDWVHIDVMDGVFVPNISFGFPVLEVIKNTSLKPLDIHLMITNPDKYIEKFASYKPEVLTVHFEACTHLHRTIQKIKSYDIKAGVAINPHTPINSLESIINEIDVVCIMSVNPGFGGQVFIENTFSKIKALKNLITKQKSNTLIQIDGGVSDKNAAALLKEGSDILVAGNYIFKSNDPKDNINKLKNIK